MNDMSVSSDRAREIRTAPRVSAAMTEAVLDMLSSARNVVDIDPGQARLLIERASRLLSPAVAISALPRPRTVNGLAPWQTRKVTRHIAENLDRAISNHELAGLAALSTNHFSRAFKRDFGVAPREYVIRRRLERARTLMLSTHLPLCQIALNCGFCDQAHMCRTFHRIVGDTPGRWRRANRPGVEAELAQSLRKYDGDHPPCGWRGKLGAGL